MNPNLQALHDAGVSIWLDDLSRKKIQSGELQTLIDEKSVSGVTTNPPIFAAAFKNPEKFPEPVGNLSAVFGRRTILYVRFLHGGEKNSPLEIRMSQDSRECFHIRTCIFYIVKENLFVLDKDPRKAELAGHLTDIGNIGKDLHLPGHFSVTVHKFIKDIHIFPAVLDFADPAVCIHSLAVVVNILRGNVRINVNFDNCLTLGRNRFAFAAGLDIFDFLFEHAAVQVISDYIHLSVLLGSEQVAGAADLEVFKGNFDA